MCRRSLTELQRNELHHDKTNKVASAPSEDSDQPGHLPRPIRVFAVRMKKALILSYPLNAQQRIWSDWADAQADLSLCWAHSHFVGFVMRWLNYSFFRWPCQRNLSTVPVHLSIKGQISCPSLSGVFSIQHFKTLMWKWHCNRSICILFDTVELKLVYVSPAYS